MREGGGWIEEDEGVRERVKRMREREREDEREDKDEREEGSGLVVRRPLKCWIVQKE